MRPCFAFSAAAGKDQPETLAIYDEIGFWGVQAKDFRTALAAVSSKTINVEINSPGGDVFAGVAIYNMLKSSGKEIVVKVMGVAASAASLIAMAGDKIQMPKNTMMMVHNPWSFAMGNADELREHADTLDKIGNSLLGTYMAKTGMAEDEMKALLAKDTWLTADEALEMGFATEITDEIKVSAKFDLARADLPSAVHLALGLSPKAAEVTPEDQAALDQADADQAALDQAAADKVALDQAAADKAAADQAALDGADAPVPVATQINDAAVKANLADFAPMLVTACASVAEATVRIATATEIKALCAIAKQPDQAKALILANKTVAEARAVIATAMAEADADTSVDTSPQSKKQTSGGSKAVTTASIWNSHNAQNVKKGS